MSKFYKMFYDTRTRLAQRMSETPRLHMGCTCVAEYETWKLTARAKLGQLLALDKMEYTSPDPQKTESIKMDGYTREKWTIATEPGVRMPFYVLLPDDLAPGEKRHAVICPHGHGSCGKEAVVGNRLFPELSAQIDKNNYDYGVQAVKRGAVAFCPDARGFGERREKIWQGDDPENMLRQSCDYIEAMAIPLGLNKTGMDIWDLMRLVDYVSALDYVDADRIGSIGLSGGALQTLYLAAMDERIRYAAISGYFYGFKQSLLDMFNCFCNYIPGLWESFDVGDIGCLIAPRPMVIETGDEDPLNGAGMLDNVYPYVEQVRSVFRMYGKEDMLYHDVFHGPHMWHGVQSIDGIDKYLK